jgi:hypothetical protein
MFWTIVITLILLFAAFIFGVFDLTSGTIYKKLTPEQEFNKMNEKRISEGLEPINPVWAKKARKILLIIGIIFIFLIIISI